MYNPLPYLPESFRKIIIFLKRRKLSSRLVFFTVGILATAWFIIRVVPKPSRAAYPCMRATAPVMSSFVLYLFGLGVSTTSFRNYLRLKYQQWHWKEWLFLFLVISFAFMSVSVTHLAGFVSKPQIQKGVFPPNSPIGEAKGIYPGRVVWMWDPEATNAQCTNTSNGNGVIDSGDDAWFMAANNNPAVLDSMVIKSLWSLTGRNNLQQAWDTLFRYYNFLHGYGNKSYTSGEKILLKINCTSAYGGLGSSRFNADLGRSDILSVNDFVSETNPYVVLSVLRQLINEAGVPQNMIYIGDPARNVYKEFYDLWHSEFPGVHVLGNNLIHPEIPIAALGRTPVSVSAENKVFFSDHGTVMTQAVADKLFTIFDTIRYLINIPALKAHSTGGITLAAKNHFGSFTREWAMHLHAGLMDSTDFPKRTGYGLYRIQTDIMMHKLLSGKNLLILVDGTYPGEDALGVPEKWEMPPFNHGWCSSIFMSLDPVAIESVCHDFLRTEYNGPTYAECRPNWDGVDDYLHQAADSSLWPAGIHYDPDNDGVINASLGVHEHWNDSLNKKYTRNLGTGNGIELYRAHESHTGLDIPVIPAKITVYPNPARNFINLDNPGKENLNYTLTELNGKILNSGILKAGATTTVPIADWSDGVYLLQVSDGHASTVVKVVKRD